MKQCSSCGLNSSEIALYCQSCGTAFATAALDPNAPPLPIFENEPVIRDSFLANDRKSRIFEIFLILFIAFGGSFLVSTHHLITGLPQEGGRDSFRWWYSICRELGALVLLWYVLRRHLEGLSHIGLRWNALDLALTPVLWALCYAAYHVAHFFIWTYAGPLLDSRMDVRVASYLFSDGVTAGTLLFGMLNPFYEELIVRAYLMTQLRRLGNNWVIVIAVSVLVQISYHFYQGTWAALSHIGEFLVLSIYFAITKRIVAPILVHLAFDMWPTIYYLVRPIH